MSTALRKPIVHLVGVGCCAGAAGAVGVAVRVLRLRAACAPVEDFGGAVGGIGFSQGVDLGQEMSGVVAGGFGAGEACGEGRPGGIGEDSVGVVWEGCARIRRAG